MEKIFLTSIFLFFSLHIFSQEQISLIEETIFETKDIDIQPNYPSGIDAFYNFFYTNFKKPDVTQLIGKIFLSFIVEKNGTLTDIKTIRDIGFGTGIEAERVLALSPKWSPGIKDGIPVRVLYKIPIAIQTE
jgi:periplasmic protein TonB